MKSKWHLIASIFQLVIGVMAVVAFAVVGSNGENMTKWVATLLLSIGFIVLGVFGVLDYKKG